MDLGGKAETAETTGFTREGREYARARRWWGRLTKEVPIELNGGSEMVLVATMREILGVV